MDKIERVRAHQQGLVAIRPQTLEERSVSRGQWTDDDHQSMMGKHAYGQEIKIGQDALRRLDPDLRQAAQDAMQLCLAVAWKDAGNRSPEHQQTHSMSLV